MCSQDKAVSLVAVGLLMLAVSAASARQRPSEKPSALEALEQSRRSLQSGTIAWRVVPEGDEARALSYVSRYARNGDMIFEHRGDKDGWTVFEPATGRGVQKYPLLYMVNADGYWEHQETTPLCMLWKRDGSPNPYADRVKDILAVGVHPTDASLRSDVGFDAVWEGMPGVINETVEWKQTSADGKFLVRAQLDSGMTITWRIDPERGWNAEHIAAEDKEGRATHEVVCSLRQYGDLWLPERTTYLRNGETVEVVEIVSAALNQRDDPAAFRGADLGLEPGTNIALQNEPMEVGKPAVWNGEAVSDWDGWIADVRAGRRQWGPMFQRMNREGRWDSPHSTDKERLQREMATLELATEASLRSHEGLWLRYVRDFIKRYQLNEEQSQKAMAILRDSQEHAARMLERVRPQLTVLSQQLEEARRVSDNDRIRELVARVGELRKPIDSVFEKELKPRLEKLPTRAQRRAAEQKEPEAPKKDADTKPEKP
jgi:hypothetical protein